MKASLILALSVLLALPAHAEPAVGDCATAQSGAAAASVGNAASVARAIISSTFTENLPDW